MVVIHLILVLYFSTLLGSDDLIPRQWNHRGEIGSYSGRDFGLWFLWGMNLFLVAAFLVFPSYSVRYRSSRQRFDRILPQLTLTMSFFLLMIHLYSLLWAVDYQAVKSENFIFVLIGLLFIFLGNILPKIPSNFFAGVRTPWTLSSEKNWYKTHRLSGYVFVIGGVLMMIRGFIEFGLVIKVIHTVIVLGFVGLYPVLYSYIIFLRERKDKEGEEK
jgi:uncharacterized membrane protein